MMKKQVFLLFDAAKEAAQSSHQETRCIVLLNRIRRNSPITTKDLLSTSIATELVLLTDHPNESIQKAATSLLNNWIKKMYHEGGHTSLIKESSFTERAPPPPRTKNASTTTTKISAPTKNLKRVRSSAASPVFKKSGACGDHTEDAVRSKVRSRLVEALSKVAGEVEYEETVARHDPNYVGGVLEAVLFRTLGPATGGNKFKWQSILFNVRDPTNPQFRRKILLGEVQPETVACMKSEDMASNKRQRENEQIRQRILSRIGNTSTVETVAQPSPLIC